MINDKKLFGIGIVGAGIAALCCFTPLLVALLGAVGLSAAIGAGWTMCSYLRSYFSLA